MDGRTLLFKLHNKLGDKLDDAHRHLTLSDDRYDDIVHRTEMRIYSDLREIIQQILDES